MLNWIDNFLNKITMYRLILYYLVALWVVGFIFSLVGILTFSAFWMAVSLAVILLFSYAASVLFAYVFEAPTNVESLYITAFILALLITPLQTGDYQQYLIFLGWVSIWSMASKFIFAIGKKHVFNPAAFAVALTALTIGQSASWWVGSLPMFVFVLIGGILVVRKLQRADLVFSFIFTAVLTIAVFSLIAGNDPISATFKALTNSALLFLAFVMLTEPLTTPPTKKMQIAYGAITGFLFAPQIHIAAFYFTPELALLVGNIFSYAVSPKEKLMLRFKKKTLVANSTYDFSFETDKSLDFRPGQYLEWTLGHEKPDSRGNRRYFTISSSPTEKDVVNMGIKFYPEPSSFKKKLLTMKPGEIIVASQLAGEFVMPKNQQQKLVFLAGGIGITPFVSMIQYLLDKKESRPIIIFYANGGQEDIAYQEVFDRASKELDIKVVYAITNTERISKAWGGHRGRIDAELIEKEVPDFQERIFYISGPHAMVVAYENILKEMGISDRHIKADFFPGFA